MSDVLISHPDIAKPDDSKSWSWCQMEGHWYARSLAQGHKDTKVCPAHRVDYNRALSSRRKMALAEQMEKTEGVGKFKTEADKDRYGYIFLGHNTRCVIGPFHPDFPGRSTLNLPHADDELLCGCVPGWPHGEMCEDGLVGEPCRKEN
jgi:hypothetical protein